jgi:hypothetical protein
MFGMFPAKQVVESKANETIQWAALKTQFFAIIFDFSGNAGHERHGPKAFVPGVAQSKRRG